LVCPWIGNTLLGGEARFLDPCYHKPEVFFQICESSEFWGVYWVSAILISIIYLSIYLSSVYLKVNWNMILLGQQTWLVYCLLNHPSLGQCLSRRVILN
jgi:hypothetical protein